MKENAKALIAMSGGVDSSVALHLMQKEGFDCLGVTMKLYEIESGCASSSAANDGAAVAAHFGIPFEVLDYSEAFRCEVMDSFAETYMAGKTPNPCIECNATMKFGRLMECRAKKDCDCLVTGHYARVEYDEEKSRYLLKKGLDETKDQSYVLYRLKAEDLPFIRFPLGKYSKSEIREIAENLGLFNAKKKDSQDICFVPDGDYASFIEKYTGKSFPDGEFVTGDGTVLGTHKGIIRYTIGQRKGLGLSLPAPLYVCEKRMDTNQVVLCSNEELFTDTLYAEALNWIAFDAPKEAFHCKAKVRYKQKEADAYVEPLPDGTVKVVFAEPQRGITPGQAVVFYEEDIVLGGGRIM